MGIKIRRVVGQGQGVMMVIYRFSYLCSVHFSAVIHKFTFSGSASLISPCEELL